MTTNAAIFLDESGDLGWNFDLPYRQGGSSRYFTIAAVVVPEAKIYLPVRQVKKLYNKHQWDPKKEKFLQILTQIIQESIFVYNKSIMTSHKRANGNIFIK